MRQGRAQRLLSARSAHAALHEHAVLAAKLAVFHPHFATGKGVGKLQVASDAGQLDVQRGYHDHHGYLPSLKVRSSASPMDEMSCSWSRRKSAGGHGSGEPFYN